MKMILKLYLKLFPIYLIAMFFTDDKTAENITVGIMFLYLIYKLIIYLIEKKSVQKNINQAINTVEIGTFDEIMNKAGVNISSEKDKKNKMKILNELINENLIEKIEVNNEITLYKKIGATGRKVESNYVFHELEID